MDAISSGTAVHKSVLKTKVFGFLILSFLILETVASVLLPSRNLTLASDLTVDNILSAVNEQRALRNLVLLNTNSKLSFAAQGKADDMQQRHYFAHVDPDGHYIWDKIVAVGYTPYSQLGENLAIEFYDTQGLITAWMNSPTHRANLLQEGFRDQGMGLTFGDAGQNQYHSAIANLFGRLVTTPKTKTETSLPISPAPKVTTKKPSSTKVTTNQPAPPTPAETSTPLQIPSIPKLAPLLETRNAPKLTTNTETETQSSNSAAPALKENSAPAIINQVPLKQFDANHYLVLGGGIILAMLLLADFKEAFEKKFAFLDKKANNLTILLISLALAAFVYWF